MVVRNGNDSFYTFYFKAENNNIRIPQLHIVSSFSKQVLKPQEIKIQALKKRKDFCGVLAADIKIKNSQVSNYDGNNSMVTLSIDAFEANIEDIVFPNVVEYGIDSLSRKFAKVSTEFYIVVDSSSKELKFTYFNTIKKQYVFITIPTILKDTSVTTQSDLNPKEDNFMKLKKYMMMILSVFFTIMFLLKRDFFYLIFSAISIITFLTLFIPHKEICVSQGSPLYLLPTQSSSISTYVDKTFQTSLLAEREPYTKIEYKKGIIGWIKNENICKD
ncbi:MAG: hypothetical protein Q9M36_06605 [Sulfurovum sp.]|nr:hypothetical protein [Sulfurovum sp.]